MSETPRKAVTISRKTWLRGEGATQSSLLRKSDSKMCCVGFICLAEGVPVDAILGKSALHNIDEDKFSWRKNLRLMNIHRSSESMLARSVYSINDQYTCSAPGHEWSEADREAKLIEALGECGYDITFED